MKQQWILLCQIQNLGLPVLLHFYYTICHFSVVPNKCLMTNFFRLICRHEELLQRQGIYAEMWMQQLQSEEENGEGSGEKSNREKYE